MTCVECGKTFELLPKKPGLANLCPDCSPASPLLPNEAKNAALDRKSIAIDTLFRNAIAEKRQAERQHQRSAADKSEKEILKWDKSRIGTRNKKAGSNERP
jgi:predicted  nucleic acid-binding Zn-ribbon protein